MFLFNRSLIVTRNDRYHKPIFAFSDGDSLYFLGDIEVALPSRLKVERFQDSFSGMRVQANSHKASVQMMLPSETLGDRIRLAQAETREGSRFQNSAAWRNAQRMSVTSIPPGGIRSEVAAARVVP